MHAQLSDKKIVCKEFIQALEACHVSIWSRLTGACNSQKDALNKCLRSERLSRSTGNREAAKGRQAKANQALKDFHDI